MFASISATMIAVPGVQQMSAVITVQLLSLYDSLGHLYYIVQAQDRYLNKNISFKLVFFWHLDLK